VVVSDVWPPLVLASALAAVSGACGSFVLELPEETSSGSELVPPCGPVESLPVASLGIGPAPSLAEQAMVPRNRRRRAIALRCMLGAW